MFKLALRISRRNLNLPPLETEDNGIPARTRPINRNRSEILPLRNPSPSPSDSDSSFYTDTMSSSTTSFAQSAISDTAQVKYHEGNKVPPTMLPGRVTPALLLQWEEHATAYFDKAKTPDAEKVSSVLTCWRDSEIDNFIKMNKARFRHAEFTFPLFMAEIRKRFLDPLWQNNIMRNVVNAKMDSSFSKFANRVIAGNNLLEGTGIRLDATSLRKTLIGNMSEFLASKLDRLRTAERDRLAAIEGFEEWSLRLTTRQLLT